MARPSVTPYGLTAFDALENMLEGNTVPVGKHRHANVDKMCNPLLLLPPGHVAREPSSQTSSTEPPEIEAKIIQHITGCFKEQRAHVSQWFATLMRQLHNMETPSQQEPPLVTQSTASMRNCTESAQTITGTDCGEFSRQFQSLQTSVASQKEYLDTIHSQLTAIEQSLKDISNRESDTFQQNQTHVQNKILESLQQIENHPFKSKPCKSKSSKPVDAAAYQKSVLNRRRPSQEDTEVLEALNKDVLAFRALRGWGSSSRVTTSASVVASAKAGTVTGILDEYNKERNNDSDQVSEELSHLEKMRATAARARSARVISKLEMASNFLVLVNTAFIGFQVDFILHAVRNGGKRPVWIFVVDTLIASFFMAELLLKIFVHRLSLFSGKEKWWNVFDTFLVVSSLIDSFFSFLDIGFLRSLRVLRAFRALKLIKSLRFVKDLRLMLASIVCSASCLFWAFVMLAVVLYLFAVFILQGVLFFLEQRGIPTSEDLLKRYGSLTATMMSLFMAISGGMDWADLIEPLLAISPWYYAIYVFFLIFVLFGMMNILTAIFCESANQIAEIDRDLVIQENISNEQSTINELRRVFMEFDLDASNTLDESEFNMMLCDVRAMRHLNTLGLDMQEAHGLFTLLDLSGSGEVSIDEFVNTLMRLKGSAKALDLATLIYENKRIMVKMSGFMRYVRAQFESIKDHLGFEDAEGSVGIHQV